jgi:hypothetical protein
MKKNMIVTLMLGSSLIIGCTDQSYEPDHLQRTSVGNELQNSNQNSFMICAELAG